MSVEFFVSIFEESELLSLAVLFSINCTQIYNVVNSYVSSSTYLCERPLRPYSCSLCRVYARQDCAVDQPLSPGFLSFVNLRSMDDVSLSRVSPESGVFPVE